MLQESRQLFHWFSSFTFCISSKNNLIIVPKVGEGWYPAVSKDLFACRQPIFAKRILHPQLLGQYQNLGKHPFVA
jgi:hypothetical protein